MTDPDEHGRNDRTASEIELGESATSSAQPTAILLLPADLAAIRAHSVRRSAAVLGAGIASYAFGTLVMMFPLGPRRSTRR